MGILKNVFNINNKPTNKTISNERLRHVSEGDWIAPNKNNGHTHRLKSGGHGQRNIELAQERHVEYNITETYKNGVRTGNYPNHKQTEKRISPNQTWFPKQWNEKDMKKAGEKVANNENIKPKPNGSKYGTYKGVRVGVFTKKDEITTVFPDKYNQDKRRK